MRLGLQPVSLSPPLFIGQAVHHALEYGYRDSVGGPMRFNEVAAQAALQEFIDDRKTLMQERVGPMMSTTEGEFDEFLHLTQAMVKHYGMWSQGDNLDERFILKGTEYQFKVPIPDSDLVYCGRFDAFVQGTKSGRYFVIDYKTARSIKTMEGVYRGMQPTTYLWAARQVYGDVDSMIYRALRKRIPDDPIPLKSGGWSKRKNQATTASWVRQFPGTGELQRMLHANEVIDGNPFFRQDRIPRSDL
jgi:ATP-dependent helicase/DNAse subunit B